MILTKTGQQHGKSTGTGSDFYSNHYSFVNVNIMYFFSTNPPANILRDETDKHGPAMVQDHGQYLNEGSEFLDDAIRMYEQPFMNTEVSVATESPES